MTTERTLHIGLEADSVAIHARADILDATSFLYRAFPQTPGERVVASYRIRDASGDAPCLIHEGTGRTLATCSTVDDAAWWLDWCVASHLMSARQPMLALVHAAAVEVEGRVWALVGPSGAGKSTLTAALVERGARYLSDEYLPLDDALGVTAFPRALGQKHRDDEWAAEGERYEIAGAEGRWWLPAERASAGERYPAPHRLVFCAFDEEAAAPHCEHLGATDALKRLLGQAPMRQQHRDAFETLARLAERVPGATLRFSDARRAAAHLMESR